MLESALTHGSNIYCEFFAVFVFLYDYWSDSDVILYCTEDDFAQMKSNVTTIALTNHPSDIDFMLSTVLFTKRFTSASSFRYFVKNDIKYVPGFGWMLWLNEQIFLKRSYEKDEGKIRKYLGKLSKLPNGFWLGLFPEGRIFSKERLEECRRIAEEKNQESFKNLLIPKWRGFVSCIQHLRTLPSNSDITIHNMTIAYENNIQPTYAGVLKGESTVAHIHIKLTPLSQIDATKESLYELYKEKDKALDDFKKYGTFKGENLISIKLAKSKFALLNFLFWMSVDLALFFMLISWGYSKHLMITFVVLYAMCKCT